MASQTKRRDKGISEYDTQVKEIRGQLTEQLRCLDSQVELRSQCLQDLGEFFRRKSEIELDYSRSLDKLAERFTSKLRSGKDHQGLRKDQNVLSPVTCWQLLLNQSRQESRDHAALSEIYSNNITLRLSHMNEDVARLSKKSKEIGLQMQEELLKVTSELQTAMKTYHAYHTESVNAEVKLTEVERLEEKHVGKSAEHGPAQSAAESKAQRRSSLRKIEKLKDKRRERYLENQLKCTKARNEYLLNLSVANAAVSHYFIHHVSTLIDCWDLGFHSALSRALRMYLSAETQVEDSRRLGLKLIESAVGSLDPETDKGRVMASSNSTFCLPNSFEFLPHDGDEVCEVRAVEAVHQDLQTRFQSLQGTLATANLETEEINKTLKATMQTLQALAASEDSDLPDSFQLSQSTESVRTASSEPSARDRITRRRAKLQDTEIYYFTKLTEHVAVSNRITKLQAKFQLLKPVIEKGIVEGNERSRLQSTLGRSQRQRRSRPCSQYIQKLFGGDLELFIKTSGQSIPLVVVSCIRFLNLYGLHHEGIFRIPGSQSEVNDIKTAFERGEDPLDTMNEHTLDSVAGVLKLYFRGLSKPIFPVESFSCLTACVETEDLLERAYKIKAVVATLEPSIIIVMRYLFAFLHHLSQYSDENMMDPHNLAVCFGPTLVTVPPDQDPVSSQARVNEAVKTVIVHHDKIFPGSEELPGPVYEKCMTQEEDYCDALHSEAAIEECEQDVLLEIHGSEDDSPGVGELRARVRFDYAARSVSELSLRKGERLRLLERVSDDWWRGETGQGKGLVPHKYIQLADTVDAGSEPLAEAGSELGSSEDRPDSSRVASLSDSESEPVPRKRSGSSPIRRRFPDGAVRIPVFQPSAPRPLPCRSPALEERLSLAAGIQERRNTLDLYQLTHSPKPVRTAAGAAGKLDRQHSERPIAELNKDMVRNMDSVFRELLQSRRHKSSSEEVQDPRKAETPVSQGTELRRSSSGALDRPPIKQGPPSKQGMKARAAALFKPSGGGTADGTP